MMNPSLKIFSGTGSQYLAEKIAKKYGIEAYPTLLFLDNYGRVVNHQVGGISAEALLAKAEQTFRKSM